MNYYNEIKNELLNNEINRKTKNYSINKSDLNTYYNVGKMLSEAGRHYGKAIIKEYSIRLTKELNLKYSVRSLYKMIKYFIFINNQKVPTVSAKLSWSHYDELLKLKDECKINYYIKISEEQNLSIRQLRDRIKSKEYEKLDNKTRNKLINNQKHNIVDFVKNPILIKNSYNYENISEKLLQKLILEDITSFMKELGTGFSFIDNEYRIKLGDRYNYIDLLPYNIDFNCYVVVELKVTELKKEYIGQIEIYMDYIDKNIKKLTQDKTIGIIICKKDNKYVIEYCSDNRIITREYELV